MCQTFWTKNKIPFFTKNLIIIYKFISKDKYIYIEKNIYISNNEIQRRITLTNRDYFDLNRQLRIEVVSHWRWTTSDVSSLGVFERTILGAHRQRRISRRHWHYSANQEAAITLTRQSELDENVPALKEAWKTRWGRKRKFRGTKRNWSY